jgi:regulatory protein YycI of two-component signal transduction system YycFG
MPSIPRIKVINRAADGDVIANKIIGVKAWNKKIETNGEVTYSSETKQLKVYKNGQIEYVVTENLDKLKLLTNKEAAENHIYDLLAAYYPLESYRLELTNATTNGYYIKLCSYNKAYEVFNNTVEASIDFTSRKITIKQGIIDFEGYNGRAKKVSVVDALVELIRHIDTKNQISIKKISLGYYADVNKNNEIIKYGEADPAWKIETDKGDYIFDGYSGNLIRNEK